MTTTPSHQTFLVALIAAATSVAAACSGGGGETSSVASLEGVAGAEAASEEGPVDQSLEGDEAALAFSECIRGQGLDFPDIGVDADGNPAIREAFQNSGVQPASDAFRRAMDECGEMLEAAGFGGRGQRFAEAEVQDAMVEFSDCIRGLGFDVGDLQLGGGPGADGPPAAAGTEGGEGTPRGQGRGQDGFGNRKGRIASALGLDHEDPDVAAAVDECRPILDEALGGFGPNAENNNS